METLALVLAGILFLVHAAAEPLLRRGRAKRFVRTRFDRGSTLVVTLLGVACTVVSFASRWLLAHGRFAPRPALVAALALAMLGGIALRVWSMRTLGELFTRTLTVAPGQPVVRAGPYRWVRHPGYLAQIVVVTAGCALASLNVRVVAAVAALLLVAYVHRIAAEEHMLTEQLGEPYSRYRSHSWRLVPGVF